MSSIVQTPHRRQAVPDPIQGVVVGINVSKGRIDWRACCLGEWGSPHRVAQGEAGFLRLEQHVQAGAEGGQEVWVALESTGPYGQCLQEWLLDRGWRVVLVNPYHVKRSRELHDGNPRKDDVKDPGVIADLVWRGSYRSVRRLYGAYAELRVGFREWCSLAKSRTALRNEAQALLELWFPELVRLFANPLGKSVQALIGRYREPVGAAAGGPAERARDPEAGDPWTRSALWGGDLESRAGVGGGTTGAGEPGAGAAGPAGAVGLCGGAAGAPARGAGALAGADGGRGLPAQRARAGAAHRRGGAGGVRAPGGVPQWAGAGEVRGHESVPDLQWATRRPGAPR